jgi:nucleoside phosphorylase
MLLALAVLGAAGAAEPANAVNRCTPRLLVLSAFPGELDHILSQSHLDQTIVIDGRPFYVGHVRGNNVVMSLTGIGLVNAEHTTRSALGYFRCGSATSINAIVFSGVAGGRSNIGDVTVPSRWTLDEKTWMPVNAEMLSVARGAIRRGITLDRKVPLGDFVCLGLDPDAVRTITMPSRPKIISGGNGKSADPFGGRAFPCIPGGGDVFGCQPCRAPHPPAPYLRTFIPRAAPFIDPGFFTGYFQNPTPSSTTFDAEDMETGAVARVAAEKGIPFLAFRAMSDGKGDPLHLPGFPFQFFIYRQLATDNAGSVTLAFLQAWANR